MATIITEVKGYTITYDSNSRLFYLVNSDGEDAGFGKTQDEVEAQADKLSKAEFTFPIQAFLVQNLRLASGRITSINLSDRSVRFVPDQEANAYQLRGHTKQRLQYTHLYEATEANKDISHLITAARNQISQLEQQIKELWEQLEKPISLDYFNLKPSYG